MDCLPRGKKECEFLKGAVKGSPRGGRGGGRNQAPEVGFHQLSRTWPRGRERVTLKAKEAFLGI